jgi:heme-degrading monooxygenase HmoA
MFAHVLDCQARVGRSEQVITKLDNDVLATLQKQPGFVDLLVLSDTMDTERLVFVSFWTSREAAGEFHQQHYETMTHMLKPVLELPPTLQGFAVERSTAYRIAVGRAA